MTDPTLEALVSNIRACRICIDDPATTPLPHAPRPVVVPSISARICIAGQAPGTRVHKSGRPFTDPSGDRLRKWMGVDEATFYDLEKLAIVPMGFCFPGLDEKGGDLPPRKECVANWHDRLFALMPQIELILVIGQYAQAYHLRDRRSKTLTQTVADWRAHFSVPIKGRFVLPLPHPSWRNNAWIKRNPWFEAELLPVLRQEVAKRL
ncbi:MAG: uracil-DNA glycosylase family protein [Pseudomonadota bacterium]